MGKNIKKKKGNVGRPTKLTQETIDKLEAVFAYGGTDEEACLYADISHTALYNYQQKHPEFVERKERLKQTPFLKARKTIYNALDTPQYAFEFMKRKKKDEFSERVEATGKDGGPIMGNAITFVNFRKNDDATGSQQ